ncbi:HEPN domain-containing protein [Dehalococcoidia bacterium]|nr:HEPN domain-containing protein [Dehalococcoidia bacterium]
MRSKEEASYRLKLAKGYVEEAEKLFDAKLWRACAGSCQLAVENACKAVIALFRPVVRTHELSRLLLDLLGEEKFAGNEVPNIEKLADYATILGLKEHILTDYGDELTYKVPWEIYKEEHAKRAMEIAADAVKIAERFVRPK